MLISRAMSSAWSFSSFGLEEPKSEGNLKENLKHDNKSKFDTINCDEEIFNESFSDVNIFITDKQRLPMMIKSKPLSTFLPDFGHQFKTDLRVRDINKAQDGVRSDKKQNCNDISKCRWTRNRMNAVSSRFLVKAKEMREFFKLTEDPVISDFLKMDSCKRISDKVGEDAHLISSLVHAIDESKRGIIEIDCSVKYLIAMVFAYFKRANFALQDYNRMNFFVALYLANDVEEDEEEIKHEIFPWALGKDWRDTYIDLLQKRDWLFKKIEYKAIISRKCCDEIMNIEPNNLLWKRERWFHHAGAIRGYIKDPKDNGMPRGPDASPLYCPDCDISDSQYDSASPNSLSWLISPCESLSDSRVHP